MTQTRIEANTLIAEYGLFEAADVARSIAANSESARNARFYRAVVADIEDTKRSLEVRCA